MKIFKNFNFGASSHHTSLLSIVNARKLVRTRGANKVRSSSHLK